MVNRDYATRVLFALSFKDLCGYQITKYISTKDERISNGTVAPVLKHLVENGLVFSSVSGRRKMYSLTEKGQRYVDEVRSIRNTLKKKIFVDSLNENVIFLDFLSNLDDATLFRELLEDIGDEIMTIVIAGFQMKKGKDTQSLGELKDRLMKLGKEVTTWHSQEMQN